MSSGASRATRDWGCSGSVWVERPCKSTSEPRDGSLHADNRWLVRYLPTEESLAAIQDACAASLCQMVQGPHRCKYGEGCAVNDAGVAIPRHGPPHGPPSNTLIQINHYIGKSLEDFRLKQARKERCATNRGLSSNGITGREIATRLRIAPPFGSCRKSRRCWSK